MRREGKQHGVVKSFLVISSKNKIPNKFESRPVAGKFHRVSRKPTNHSKPTGFRYRLESHGDEASPVCKPHDKVKGAQKFRCSNLSTDQRLLAFQVAGKKERSNYGNVSATEILDRLTGDALDLVENEEEYSDEDPRRFNREAHRNEDNYLIPYNDHSSQHDQYETDEVQLEPDEAQEEEDIGASSHQDLDLAQFASVRRPVVGDIVGSYFVEAQEEDEEEIFDFLIWNDEAYSEIGKDAGWCVLKEGSKIYEG